MPNHYRVLCLSEALSPITHMMGVEGNEAMINRESVITDRGTRRVPVLSGNAIRNRMVRAPGGWWLIDRYGLRGHLLRRQLQWLLSGGNLSQSTQFENTRRRVELRRLLPQMALVGGALPDQIIDGSLRAGRGTLVCRENAGRIGAMLPGGWSLPEGVMRSAESLVSDWQYTRGDAAKHVDAWSREREPSGGGESNLMIFSGQEVSAGALFFHDFLIENGSDLEAGALLHALRRWAAGGSTVGGQSSRGHGRLDLALCVMREGEPINGEIDALVGGYQSHADEHRDEAVAWLYEAFGSLVPEEVAPVRP